MTNVQKFCSACLTHQCAPLTSTSRLSRSAAALTFLVALGVPAAALAHEATGPCAAMMDPNNAPSTDPRIEHISVAGTHVNVLLPPRYHQDHGRRYPVLYLFHGAFSDEDSFSTQTNVLSFTASQPEHRQVIVVMPDGSRLPAGRDWVDGAHPQETFVIKTLLPYIDAHYRTLDDGGHRAGAGFSGGGMNAAVYAARHPELFAAVGSFSGFLDPYDSTGIEIVQEFVAYDDDLCGSTIAPNDLWGDPDTHPMGWTGHDPVYLARGLHDLTKEMSMPSVNAVDEMLATNVSSRCGQLVLRYCIGAEIRNPKHEIRNKSEGRKKKRRTVFDHSCFGFVSGFDIRVFSLPNSERRIPSAGLFLRAASRHFVFHHSACAAARFSVRDPSASNSAHSTCRGVEAHSFLPL
jgi:S-formylglutathione hydrolase FrmB